jgi:hypothetical protein
MKRVLRSAVLVALLGLACWFSMPSEVSADMPYCGDIQGMFCVSPGLYIYCYSSYNDYSICTCNASSETWWCN